MICYKDMTFCVSPGCQDKCGRKLTDEVRAGAKRWWGGDDAPICVGHFCDDGGEVLRASPSVSALEEKAIDAADPAGEKKEGKDG